MRIRLVVRGTLSALGVRPFVHRTARAHGLTGWIRNGRDALHIEVQGDGTAVRSFAHSLEKELPPSSGNMVEQTSLEDRDESSFEILDEREGSVPFHPADLVTCASCLAEVAREDGRRHRYPFTSCAACGPRWSISTGIPYDRRHTSMRSFTMCGECAAEYDDPKDRRHRAQPIACPNCGPELSFLGPDGRMIASGDTAIRRAVAVLTSSGIVAVRGLGGFQLLCDATDPHAVGLLRLRKNRPDKPLPVMFRDRAQLEASAEVSPEEWQALSAREGPIVLVTRRREAAFDERGGTVRSPLIGAVLPSTPLHALLLEGAARPLVCTSGNEPGEPQCTNGAHAVSSLSSIADGFLDHDRSIVRPLEDSVVRATPRRRTVIRRARGYVPRRIGAIDPHVIVLALGGQQRSTVTVGYLGALVPSQHLGDLESPSVCALLETTARDLCGFFDARPSLIACDRNANYASSVLGAKLTTEWGAQLLQIQHHHAHVAATMAEHGLGLDRKVLGLVWDGPGVGDDGKLWGGEALVCLGTDAERIASITAFPLLGGDRPSAEPRRATLGVLFEHLPGELLACTRSWAGAELDSCLRVLERRLAPMCSSIGRLFDVVAVLSGIRERLTFDGQAAMELEHLAASVSPDGAYPFPLVRDRQAGGMLAGDTRALASAVLEDVRKGVEPSRIARRFHEALIVYGFAVAEHAGILDVIPTGECFQNHLLIDGLEAKLERAGFRVHIPAELPTNDGALSVGQAWLAAQHATKSR